jgi:hypothetical protein
MKGITVLVFVMIPTLSNAEVNVRAHYGNWDYFVDNTGMTYATDAQGNQVALMAQLSAGRVTVQFLKLSVANCKKPKLKATEEILSMLVDKQWIKMLQHCSDTGSIAITPYTEKGSLWMTKRLKNEQSIKLFNANSSHWATFSAKGFLETYNAIMARSV